MFALQTSQGGLVNTNDCLQLSQRELGSASSLAPQIQPSIYEEEKKTDSTSTEEIIVYWSGLSNKLRGGREDQVEAGQNI